MAALEEVGGFCLSLLASWTPGLSGLPCELVLMWLPYCRRTAATEDECRAAPAPGSPSVPALGSGTVDGLDTRREDTHRQGARML